MTKQIIKSNTGSLGPLPDLASLNRDLPITSVTLETKDLKDADAYLTFTCHVNLPESTTANLVFIIKKYCDKGSSHEIGSSYVFSGVSTDSMLSKMFSFQFIDKDIHPGKYTYSIQLASNSMSNCNEGTTITNAILNLVAIGNEKDSKGNSKGNSKGSNSSQSSTSENGNSQSANSQNATTVANDSSTNELNAQKDNKENKKETNKKDKESEQKDSQKNSDKKKDKKEK